MYCAVLLCGADLLVRNASPAVTRATVEFQMHRLLVRLHHGLMVRAGAGAGAGAAVCMARSEARLPNYCALGIWVLQI